MDALLSFLQEYQVEKGSKFTHTSIYKPSGSFYIPFEKLDTFYDLYEHCFNLNHDLHLTEKHAEVSPVLIDIDFRYPKTESVSRKHTIETITKLLELYSEIISEYVVADKIVFYVLEKEGPVVEKDVVKDGIHIVIPNIITKPAVQYIIRERVLNKLGTVFDDLGLINSYDDVVDKAVIYQNNWQMYGSKKPGCNAYKITGKYVWKTDTCELLEKQHDNLSKFVRVLSIRNKFCHDACDIKIEKISEIEKYEDNISKAKQTKMLDSNNSIFQKTQNITKNTSIEFKTAVKLVEILDNHRADNYSDWIRLGWCLRNIDHRLLDTWIEFSRRSRKFEEGACERLWNYMKGDGLGIGSLNLWAKTDNYEKYQEISKSDIHALIKEAAANEAHHDVAAVLYHMYKYNFVCASIKNNIWYEFRDHRWVQCDSGHTLRAKISTQLYEVFRDYSRQLEQSANALSESDDNKVGMLKRSKKVFGLAIKLKQVAYKENIMRESREFFYIEKFEEKLDAKPHLLGFENGVYDLIAYEFREGRPEDYISNSTKINYIPYDPSHEFAADVECYLSQVFTNPDIKEYVMCVLASFLNGSIREERFHIWTGSGSNSKSIMINLYEKCIGTYSCKLPVTLLTQKRAASNAATGELARTKGKRFACLQEPSENEKLNVGLMKELTGGDTIMARMLYQDPIEFKPQFKMILTCNTLPNVPSDDGGTWRRIRVVEFTSRFCDNPDPEKENEFPIDKTLADRMEDWREYFMSLLVVYYRKYAEDGIKEPEDVLRVTRDYQKSNDILMEFIDNEITKAPGAKITLSDFMNTFRVWIKENAPGHAFPTDRKTFLKSLVSRLGVIKQYKKVPYFMDWNFKAAVEMNEEVDDLE